MLNRGKKRNQPPGPKGKVIKGSLNDFQAGPLPFLFKTAKEYGPISCFRFGPFQNVYLVNEPDLIKEILVTKQKSFVKSRDIQTLKAVVGEGLLTSEKDMHMQQRRMIQPSFKKSHISSYAQDMIDTTHSFISKWKNEEEKVITDDMMDIALGIITKTMFSMDFEEGAKKLGEPMDAVMKIGVKRMRSLIQLPLWLPTKNNRKLKKAVSKLDQEIYQIIERRRQEPGVHSDLLGVLMEAKDEDDGEGMSDLQLRDELMTIFLAGHETTANLLSWTLYLLSQNPKAEKKLCDEILHVTGDNPVTPKNFADLPYTQFVIWESMRLYPPAYVIGRQVDKKVNIGGYHFKKGEMVLMSQYVMHRNPEYFDNPEEFIPDRFADNFMKKLPTYAYFPFGGGPRVCVGNHFSLMEGVLALAVMMKEYSVKMAPNHGEITPQPLVTLRPKHGLRMIVKRRASNS
ncbi:cytochrome P450 [Salipaludibacillus sp. CF4.18]|uniref:cytochrome P450 n=1 Tax=Salipaludibacillus sp. CF4.18 TaxID=3373081 RepID=UPI003EE55B99